MRLASRIEPEWLLDLFADRVREESEVSWNEGGERVESSSRLLYENLVIEESRDTTDYRFPLCIVEGKAFGTLGNVDVSVRLRPVMGKVDQAGGIAIRLKDPRNYYVVRANALENNVRLYAVIDGDRKQFAGKSVVVTSTQWHTLRLRVVGDRFTVYFDNALLFEATRAEPLAPPFVVAPRLVTPLRVDGHLDPDEWAKASLVPIAIDAATAFAARIVSPMLNPLHKP